MLYQKTLKIPANTPAEKPYEEAILIKHPVISRLYVFFPAGCMMLAHVAIFYGDMQIWPAKEGEWCAGDNIVIQDEPYLEMPERWTKLRLVGWNEDPTWDLPVTFYIIAQPRIIAMIGLAVARLVQLFEVFLGIFRIKIPKMPLIR